ncbi:MAG: hypothetical protein ABFS32_00920 [Bacteroidota bacterium]
MGKHEIDKLFSDKLEELEYQPQVSSWERVEEALDQKSGKVIWPWVGIAASAVLAMSSFWYFLDKQVPENNTLYSYLHDTSNEITVPAKVYLIPVIINVESTQNIVKKDNPQEKPLNIEVQPNPIQIESEEINPTLIASNDLPENTIKPVMEEALPEEPYTEENTVIASSGEIETEVETETDFAPLTIIYKQGSKEDKTNFEKAYAYLEEVSKGEKRLLDFRRLGENIKSKFNSSTETNSP